MTQILVVEDHPLFRDGFSQMATVLRPSWRLLFADTAAAAIALLEAHKFDLAIIDVALPDQDGFSLAKLIALDTDAPPLILLSGRDDATTKFRARTSGARSFIAKISPPEQIAETIDAVLAGETRFEAASCDDPKAPALSSRQLEILMLLADGHGNKEIRHRLGIAERTVRAHLTELFRVLGVHSRMQALLRARELDIIA